MQITNHRGRNAWKHAVSVITWMELIEMTLNPRSRGRITVTLMSGPQDGKTLEWDRPEDDSEMVLTIGRREGCDISLDYDTQVSRIHARLVYSPLNQRFYLE